MVTDSRDRNCTWERAIALTLCALSLALAAACGPAAADVNTWQIRVEPEEIVGNETRVTVTAFMDIYSGGPYTFSRDNQLVMRTDLEEAVWLPVLLYDGIRKDLPARRGKAVTFTAWELSYPSGKGESLKVTLTGWAPVVDADGERTMLWLAEESPNGVVNHTEKRRAATVLFRPGATRKEPPAVPAGTLHVSSDPPGAEVTLGGEKKGKTPVTVEVVPAGEHPLTLTLPGYHPAVLNVTVVPREAVRVSVRLVPGAGPAGGALRVASVPGGATLILDGVERGKTPLSVDAIEPGTHVVRLELEGFEPYEGNVPVTAGGVVVHSVALTPLAAVHSAGLSAPGLAGGEVCEGPAAVTVTSDPRGAKVTLDGEFVGLTPVRLAQVPPGPHSVTVTFPFFSAYAEEFVLGPCGEEAIHHAFGLGDLRLPGPDILAPLFSGLKIPPFSPGDGGTGKGEKPAAAFERERAYEDLLRQMGSEGE
ncbi:MAG: PEGA domain-containing protein [Methanolinea sp.]|nr:PEGA domain-containing protein [Methanolinea sp.]